MVQDVIIHSFIMSHRVKKHLPELRVLSMCTPRQRKAYLKHANKSLIDCLSECCVNTLKGNVPLAASQKKSLSRHKKHIRKAADKRNSSKSRRDTFIQKGGFLSAILGPILRLLTG